MRRGVRRGCVRLRGAVVGIDDEDDATFTVTVDNKTFHFQVLFKSWTPVICRLENQQKYIYQGSKGIRQWSIN